MKLKDILKKVYWIPFVIGVAGYFGSGELNLVRSIYASAALYFVNPVTEVDNPVILCAKILALLVTASAIISIANALFGSISHFFIRLSSKAVVVYSDADNEYAEKLMKSIKKGYLVSDPKKPEKVGIHFLFFADDRKTVGFYTRNRGAFGDSAVYLILRELDPFLLQDTADTNVHYLNVHDITARVFWRDHSLYERIVRYKKTVKIAFPVYDAVTLRIFKYAYLNNIFSSRQRIEYHIFGASLKDRDLPGRLKTMTDDEIRLYDDTWEAHIDELSSMDMIFVSGDETMGILQALLGRPSTARIFCYAEDGNGFDGILSDKRVETFGGIEDTLTGEEILHENIDRNAKLFNYDYELRSSGKHAGEDYMEQAEGYWKKLNGFYRGSNIARADHYRIERKLISDGVPADEIQKAEHIRWSRYYFYNGWTYDPVRDNSLKKHHLLIPYEDLPESEKKKDGIYDEKLRAVIEENDRREPTA